MEHLYRGKTKHSKKWVYGNLIDDGHDYYICEKDHISPLSPNDGNYDDFVTYVGYEVNAETIGKYIGLPDKNGKKIFENDIVTYDNIHFWKVVFKNFSWQCICKECGHGFEDEDRIRISLSGNIHDNPELLN